MGAIGYATQAGLYFSALDRMDASLLALLLYTYPALVVVLAIALGRESASRRRVAALILASTGAALVLAGAGTGTLDPLGTVMGIGAAVTYAVYILVGAQVVAGVPPLTLAALVTAGATFSFAVIAFATGGPDLGFRTARLGVARRDRDGQHGRRDPHLLRRPRAGRPVGRRDPLDARNRRSPSSSPRWPSTRRSPPCNSSAALVVLASVFVLNAPGRVRLRAWVS